MKAITTIILVVSFIIELSWAQEQARGDIKLPAVSLHVAVLQDDINAIQQYIAAGANLNEKDAYGSTPLMIAATFNRPEAAQILIQAGVDLNVRNNEGGTALHAAAFLCHIEVVKVLLQGGANRFIRDSYGNTPLGAVSTPFDAVKGTYDTFANALGPLGLELDYEQLKALRPRIADMLRPTPEELLAIDYVPVISDDWQVSTPEAQGLDPMLIAELYLEATGLETLDSLIVVKNGYLISEAYFNDGALEHKALLQSVSKSFTSALVGLAFEQGCLTSLDQKMMEFFPEFTDEISDTRKEEITIRHLLQMRAGYPWEESSEDLLNLLYSGFRPSSLVDVPLVTNPGSAFHYSNLSSHILGIIVTKACDVDLKTFAQEYLFTPLGIEVGDWIKDWEGYYLGFAGMHFTARDAAKFGQLYLNDGVYKDTQIIPADWVAASLQKYSDDAWEYPVGPYFLDIGYGYQWWSARAGRHHLNLAWGHGGQLVFLLEGLNMVIVVTADPFDRQSDDESWLHEKANINLVTEFINDLPTQ